MKKIILFLMMVAPLMIHASGIITISGKLVSITDSHYRIETANAAYAIKRGAVPEGDANKFTKTGILVSLTVPMDVIENIEKPDLSFKKTKKSK